MPSTSNGEFKVILSSEKNLYANKLSQRSSCRIKINNKTYRFRHILRGGRENDEFRWLYCVVCPSLDDILVRLPILNGQNLLLGKDGQNVGRHGGLLVLVARFESSEA